MRSIGKACALRNMFGIGALVALGVASSTPVMRYAPASPSAVDALSVTYDCSNVGLAAGVIPAGALVTNNGVTVHTSFAAGWAVYMRTAPGVLAAVCVR